MLLYGVDLLLASLTLSMLILYLAREPALLVDNIAEGTLRRVTRESSSGRLSLGMITVATTPVIGADGTLYVIDRGVVAIDPSGRLLWRARRERERLGHAGFGRHHLRRRAHGAHSYRREASVAVGRVRVECNPSGMPNPAR